jgi:hypothetical protein
MKTFNIHIGHFIMTFAIMLGMGSVALMVGDATPAEFARIMISSVGTFAILGIVVHAIKV